MLLLSLLNLQALRRLTPREEYDRAYRLRLASQLSVLHHPLPKEQHLTAQQVGDSHRRLLKRDLTAFLNMQDQRYLTPLITEIIDQEQERKMLDTAVINKPKRNSPQP